MTTQASLESPRLYEEVPELAAIGMRAFTTTR